MEVVFEKLRLAPLFGKYRETSAKMREMKKVSKYKVVRTSGCVRLVRT